MTYRTTVQRWFYGFLKRGNIRIVIAATSFGKTKNNEPWDCRKILKGIEICLRECFDAVECVLVSRLHSLEPEPLNHALQDVSTRTAEPEEGAASELLIELRSVAKESARSSSNT